MIFLGVSCFELFGNFVQLLLKVANIGSHFFAPGLNFLDKSQLFSGARGLPRDSGMSVRLWLDKAKVFLDLLLQNLQLIVIIFQVFHFF